MSEANDVTPHRTSEIGVDKLNRFLKQEFPASKAAFLEKHGTWFYHRTDVSRWVFMREDGTIVAHAGGIKLWCLLNGERQSMHWCLDLIVGREYRNGNYHRTLIYTLQTIPELALGFPNDMSRLILRRAGWRLRSDGRRFSVPLSSVAFAYLLRVQAGMRRPRKARRRSQKIKMQIRRVTDKLTQLAARGLSWPLFQWRRSRLARYTPVTARRVLEPDADMLAGVFMRHNAPKQVMTMYRDADYLRWRYVESPLADEQAYYVAGPEDAPTHVLITRTAPFRGLQITRILDLFGDLDDQAGMRDVIQLALSDAARAKSALFTTTAWFPGLIETFRALKFWEVEELVFSWYSKHGKEMMDKVDHVAYHWVMGDSDADLF